MLPVTLQAPFRVQSSSKLMVRAKPEFNFFKDYLLSLCKIASTLQCAFDFFSTSDFLAIFQFSYVFSAGFGPCLCLFRRIISPSITDV